jgi:hypothetical protein
MFPPSDGKPCQEIALAAIDGPGERIRAGDPCGHRSGSATACRTRVRVKPAGTAAKCLHGAVPMIHIWIMRQKPWKGNPDTSRCGVAGIASGGPDDRLGPLDSADAGDWRRAAAVAWLTGGRRDCNSVVHDHSGSTGKTWPGIRSKIVVEEPHRRCPPCLLVGGTGHRGQFRGRLEPDCMW